MGARLWFFKISILSLVVTILASAVTTQEKIEEDNEKPPAVSCLPHKCLGMELDAAEQQRLLSQARRELELVARLTLESMGNASKLSSTDNRVALLITAGGPPRAESIVQAHVLMNTARRLHNDTTLPIELWHAGEIGMVDACRLWAREFAPFQCQHAWERATDWRREESGAVKATINQHSGELTALAVALGLTANEEHVRSFRRETLSPVLEWVRGWPIKPLALLLTEWDLVVMVDADSIPVRPLEPWLRRIEIGGGDTHEENTWKELTENDGEDARLARLVSKKGTLFWPDIMECGEAHQVVRDALGLNPIASIVTGTSEASAAKKTEPGGDGEKAQPTARPSELQGATSILAAESGQLVVDRTRHLLALRAAWVLNAHPIVYTLLHGDKDTYRIAFDFAASYLAIAVGDHVEAVYQQVELDPFALGGLGPQAMIDGSSAFPRSQPVMIQESTANSVVFGERNEVFFCGQALLQRSPINGAPIFVHRVLAKYNVMNLVSETNWHWMTSPPIPNPRSENEPSGVWPIVGPSLQQEGWCLTYHTEMSARGMSTSVTPTDPSLLDIAKFAIKSRMGMADLF